MQGGLVQARQPFPNKDFWQNRRVVITGHTGFKGTWMSLWLLRLGAHVTGLSLRPISSPSLFNEASIGSMLDSNIVDIRDPVRTKDIIQAARPEILFHMAAQPLVRQSYLRPVETFAANFMGTVHVLEALRAAQDAKVAVMITTDKVYANREWVFPYREDDPLGGHDPYSSSKAASEIAIASYRLSFLDKQGVAVSSARAGNVIGGGDWADDRLIPDAVRAWQAGEHLQIRRPSAVRPWQHVLEPLNSYLVLAERLYADKSLTGSYNIGPDSGAVASVGDVIRLAQYHYGAGKIKFESESDGLHEANLLALETSKIRSRLGIRQNWALDTAVIKTMSWYKQFYNGVDAKALCYSDIREYEGLA